MKFYVNARPPPKASSARKAKHGRVAMKLPKGWYWSAGGLVRRRFEHCGQAKKALAAAKRLGLRGAKVQVLVKRRPGSKRRHTTFRTVKRCPR